jgi:hypothetical protein
MFNATPLKNEPLGVDEVNESEASRLNYEHQQQRT